jgi:uncharacterized protein YndB with AHSA1/START domain
MPTVRRTRTLAASPEHVWRVVEDPHHLPRWWPGVSRMEGVEDDRWTKVFTTRKGRPVRADFRLLESEPPGAGGEHAGRRVWEQDVAGTPFERVLNRAVTEITLGPDGDGTRVELKLQQKLRGYSRAGGWMLRRATRAKLDEALDGLARICG